MAEEGPGGSAPQTGGAALAGALGAAVNSARVDELVDRQIALTNLQIENLALEKFAQANMYAPHWARLHLKWGEALSYLGRKDEAVKQLALAKSLNG